MNSKCRDLYLDYKSICNLLDPLERSCQHDTFSTFSTEQLRQYIILNLNKINILNQCQQKRYIHSNVCYGGVMDPGHQKYVDQLQRDQLYCEKRIKEAQTEYGKRFLDLFAALGNFKSYAEMYPSLEKTLYLRGLIHENKPHVLDYLNFELVDLALNQLLIYGSFWIIH